MKVAALVSLALVATAGVYAEDPLARALRELQTTATTNANPGGDNQLSAVLSKISSALKGRAKSGVPDGDAAMEALQRLDKKGKLASASDDFFG